MEVNAEKAEAAKACFDFNKNLYLVYVTSDMSCFPGRGDAINHARGLTNTSIDVFERDAEEGVVVDEEKTDSANDSVADVPDLKLAVVKAAGGAKDKKFAKVAVAAPAATDETAPAEEAPAPAATDETAPAEEAPAPAAPDETVPAEEAPAPAATDETAPAEEAPAPAAPDETAPAEEAPAPAAPDETAPAEEAPAPAATDENITEKLTDLVDELETILHLKDKK